MVVDSSDYERYTSPGLQQPRENVNPTPHEASHLTFGFLTARFQTAQGGSPKSTILVAPGNLSPNIKTDGGSLWGLSHHLVSEKGEWEGFSEYSYSSFSPMGKVIQPEVLTLPTLF